MNKQINLDRFYAKLKTCCNEMGIKVTYSKFLSYKIDEDYLQYIYIHLKKKNNWHIFSNNAKQTKTLF